MLSTRKKVSLPWNSIILIASHFCSKTSSFESLTCTNMMRVIGIRQTKKVHPTGDKNFAVQQAFPAAFSAEESDPFLMCDYFSAVSTGVAKHPDDFKVGWHPHRGMDICTYMKEGVGRHADSLGNRGTFETPGMQWISVGSGIEHAEAGGTPAGQNEKGFQIWINVPSSKKMDDPRYGTVSPNELILLENAGVFKGRLLAGELGNSVGPFQTVAPLLMIDYELFPNAAHELSIPTHLDNVIIFVYGGDGNICNSPISTNNVMRLDAGTANRTITFLAGSSGLSLIVFAGKRLNQPIAWHGPFVMTTDSELETAMQEYRNGNFLKKRAAWDYKRIDTFPSR